MYGRYFGLESAPFRITPDTRRFYTGAGRGEILDALQYSIEHGEGIVKLSSEIGSGKTMLCRMLADRLASTVDVIYLANPSVERDDVLRAIALELRLPCDGDRLQLLHALHEYLLRRHAEGRRVVAFVEEAQGMDLAALEEIRLLSNLETREDKLLQLVLFGQPELDAHLAVKQVRQLRDRITQSFSLPPLSLAELRDYVPFRLRAAGCRGGDPFTPAAYRLLRRCSSGLIRRVHILADKALLAAFADHSCQVTARHMRRAIADSEFAPRRFTTHPAWIVGVGIALVTIGAAGQAVVPNIRSPRIEHQPVSITPSVPDVAKAVTVAPVTATPGNASLVTSRLSATHNWLQSEHAANYTIQVMTIYSDAPAPLEKIFSDPSLTAHLDKLYLVTTHVGGTKRWSVLYGAFENYGLAQQALKDMPVALKGKQPFLRTIKAIKTEATGASATAEQDT